MQTRMGVQISFDALALLPAPDMALVPMQTQPADAGVDLAALFSETLQSAFAGPAEFAADIANSEEPQHRPKQGEEPAVAAGVLGPFPFLQTPLQMTPAAPVPVEHFVAGNELPLTEVPAAVGAGGLTTDLVTPPVPAETLQAISVPAFGADPQAETAPAQVATASVASPHPATPPLEGEQAGPQQIQGEAGPQQIQGEAVPVQPSEKDLPVDIQPVPNDSGTHTQQPSPEQKTPASPQVSPAMPRDPASEATVSKLPPATSVPRPEIQAEPPVAPTGNANFEAKVDASPLRPTNKQVRGSQPDIDREGGFSLAEPDEQKFDELPKEAAAAPAPVTTPGAPAQPETAPAPSPRPAPLPVTPEVAPVGASTRESGEIAFTAQIRERNQAPSVAAEAPEQAVAEAFTSPAEPLAGTGQADSKIALPAEANGYRAASPAPNAAVHRTEPAPVAEPAHVAAVREVQEQPRPASQGIAFQIGERDERIHVHLRERDGAIQVAVRSPNPDVAQSLRSNLGDLSGQLQNAGFRSEIVTPVRSEQSLDMQPQDSGANSDQWSDQQQDGRRRQDYDSRDGEGRQRPRRPFWEDIDE